MNKKLLGVNIDHVATVRNARGENYPDPTKAALIAQSSGADSITIHLRDDRRHIREYDLINIKKKVKIPLNLEMSPTKKMLNIALRYKPDYVCLVPEKRNEITTEGGLNLKKNKKILIQLISKLKKNSIRVSLFINPSISDVRLSKEIGADCVELHTGRFCINFNKKKNINKYFNQIKNSALYADKLSLLIHAGHGLTYKTALKVSKIDCISEYNSGHFIVAESIFNGLKKTIRKFKILLRN